MSNAEITMLAARNEYIEARLDQAVVVGLPQMIASASAPIQGTKREVGS